MSMQDQATAALAGEVAGAISAFWDSDFSRLCQSEIERGFASAVIIANRIGGVIVSPSREAAAADQTSFIEPQVEIGPYRVDFLIGHMPEGSSLLKCIVVECDGHDFHERTKEQAQRDKARDRYLSTRVGKVVRFTGSEIYRNPVACAVDAARILHVLLLGEEGGL